MKTFSHTWRYVVIALVIAMLIFTLIVGIQNWQLLSSLWTSSYGSLSEKMVLTLTLYTSLGTNFTLLSAFTTIGTAVLFGINISMLLYYIQRVRGGARRVFAAGGTSFGGLVAGLLGIGCAACGTFIATSILSLFGAATVLSLLPLGGEEFGVVAVGVLTYSVYRLYEKINSPLICPVI